jgi:RNA polymerase sigma-70 factor (ECF subfamily)
MIRRDNQTWINDLNSVGSVQAAALEDLRAVITRGLSQALIRYLKPNDPHFQTLVEESTQETLLKVLDNLPQFEGRSRFTTWVYKIAVRTALTELRRKRWKNVSLDEMIEEHHDENFFPANQITVAKRSEQNDLIDMVNKAVQNHLTEKQRVALMAVGNGVALEEVARRLGTNRNAVYKLLHDARKKLKNRLYEEGLNIEEILAVFEG